MLGVVVLAPAAYGASLRAPNGEAAIADEPGQALGATPCVGGMAGIYPCQNVDLMAFMPIASIGGSGSSGSDIWGWTDPVTGHEWAILGRSNGTSFVDITDAANPVYVGNLLTHTGTSTWREMKTHGNYVYVVSDNNGTHGLQIFDLTRLRNVTNPPVTFTAAQADGHYSGFGRCHDVTVDTQSGFLYCVGTDTFSGGLHILDLANPTNPTFVGASNTNNGPKIGYIHDTQCVVYHGPDVAHQGQQICFASNPFTGPGGIRRDRLTIIDVTNKSASSVISATRYAGSGYAHQGWLTEDHRYFLMDDELDEMDFGHNTKTYMWDLLDLDAPVLMGFHLGPTTAIDHNQFIKGHYSYQANYTAGLRILDLTNLPSASLTEVAYFDIVPSNNTPSFNGSWGVYPFFASGTVIVSGMNGSSAGLFILRPSLSADFSVSTQPSTLGTCAAAGSTGDVTVSPSFGYVGAVTFGTTGLPAGALATFEPAGASVPGSSSLTVSADGIAPGSYPFSVTATDGTITRQASATLSVATGLPPAATLAQPANGAADQPQRPSFTWQPVPGATGYELQIASGPTFTTVVQSATGLGTTTHTASSDLATNTTYYWRVRAVTACGTGPYSAPRSFTTAAPLAGCPLGTTAETHLTESFEGRPRWSHSGTGDTWQASPARAHHGTLAMHAADTPDVSDQRLVSPSVTLPPATQAPVTLQFWNWQDIESAVPGAKQHVGCQDGGVLEVSNDGGATWTPLETQLLTDPSDGQIGTGTGNPLAGLGAWCGSPQDWLNSVADLTEWAGQTVRFRFRLGTDQVNGREGWYVDELKVQSCRPNPTPTLAISDVTGEEPDHHEHSPLLTFQVSLSAPSAQPVTVEWSTADGTASGGLDYIVASGTVTFPPGSTSQVIDAEMLADGLVEPAETFLVNLSRPVGATLQDDQGIGTILDAAPEKVASRPR
jgi:choice-of-anchor B domain-containing protein